MLKPRSLTARLVLAGTALGLSFILGVGLIDLCTGQTFLHGFVSAAPRTAMTDEERVAAAARNKGAFASATDPHVGITMMRGATRKVVDAEVTLDDQGQRVRVGPPAEDGATRIVILGDSVAFGFGLADDQTIAHHLEDHLAATVIGSRPRPIVSTIACPGWNQRNACRYILNHLARLRPDIVVFYPIGNDLHDGYTVNEGGHRSLEFDSVRGAGLPHTSAEQWSLLMNTNYKGASTAALMRIRAAGGINRSVAHVVTTALTPESKRRWDAAVTDLRDLDARLRARGCRFAIGIEVYDEYTSLFHARVGRALPEIPLTWSLEKLSPLDSLPNDPHPSPRFARTLAWSVAQVLLTRGWIDGADATRLPKLAPEYAGRMMKPPTIEAAERLASDRMAVWDEFIGSEIILRDTTGFHQIYGAVHGDGTVNRSLWLALKNPGEGKIRLDLERLTGESGVYPLHVEIAVNDSPGWRIEIPAPEPGGKLAFSFEFDVPAAHASDRFLDILIKSSNWVVEKTDGISRMASFRFVRIGFE